MNAAATTGNPSPARTWNGSCPGTPTPETSAPGHSRPRPDNRTGTAAITASPRTRSRRPLAYPITGLPNTYPALARGEDPVVAVHDREDGCRCTVRSASRIRCEPGGEVQLIGSRGARLAIVLDPDDNEVAGEPVVRLLARPARFSDLAGNIRGVPAHEQAGSPASGERSVRIGDCEAAFQAICGLNGVHVRGGIPELSERTGAGGLRVAGGRPGGCGRGYDDDRCADRRYGKQLANKHGGSVHRNDP